MKKGILIVGIILLIVGAILLVLPGGGGTSMKDLKDDYDVTKLKFKSYSAGDTVKVTGEITKEDDILGVKSYVLDDVNDMPFTSTSDLGNVGDTVTVEFEVVELLGIQTVVAKSASSGGGGGGLFYIGIILLLVGIILAIVGAVLKSKPKEQPPPPPPPQQF